MSTRWPLCLIVMELAAQLASQSVDLTLKWRRRDVNVEADALTNHEFEGFNPKTRVLPDLEGVKWLVLPWLEKEATKMYASIRAEREQQPLERAARAKRSVLTLRQSAPW